MKTFFVLLIAMSVTCVFGGEWRGLSEENRYSGKSLSAKDFRRKIVLVEEWSKDIEASETMAFVEKCWRGYSSHPFIMIASHKGAKDDVKVKEIVKANALTCPVYQGVEYSDAPQSDKLPFFYVVNTSGKVVYTGHDKNEAITTVVNELTNLPIPGDIVSGVRFKKFRSLKRRIVMGKKIEGYLLSPVKKALKSKRPAERAEAESILQAVETAKKNLERSIEEEKALGEEANKGTLLRDLRWMILTWPSEKKKYEEDFMKLSKDPDAVKGEKAWFEAQKKKGGKR